MMPKFKFWSEEINKQLAKTGYIGRYDPRHIEAYMRLPGRTLGDLSDVEFAAEVEISRQCVDADGLKNAESCAKSFGF